MKLLDRIKGALLGSQVGASGVENAIIVAEEAFIQNQDPLDKAVKESIADLELALEDTSWRSLNSSMGIWNFSRAALLKIIAHSRLMYLVNPLIKRAVTVQELYVWGSGCTIRAENAKVQEVLEDFFNDPKNQQVVGSSWTEREREQRVDGNTFFVFFLNKYNGTSRVRLIPVEQIEEIITNPDDSKEVWFYKRTIVQGSGERIQSELDKNSDGITGPILFPDIDYHPKGEPATVAGIPVKWDARILHVKTGGLSSMKYGVPELFCSHSWATAYKGILENFATILRAYARMAIKISGLPGRKGVAAAKQKLGTGISTGRALDNNPPENTASMALLSGNVDVSAIKTSNMTTAPDQARALRSMVAAGSDTPEHFFGDSDIGNFATSTTLDRPTELKMIARQAMWSSVQLRMCQNLIMWSARAPSGKLRSAGFRVIISPDLFDGTTTWRVIPPSPKAASVLITFPNILEREVTDRVRAVVQAATLGGSKNEGVIPDRKFLFNLLMVALGRKDAEDLTDKYYPQEVLQGFADPKIDQDIAAKKADASMKAAERPISGPNVSTSDGNVE